MKSHNRKQDFGMDPETPVDGKRRAALESHVARAGFRPSRYAGETMEELNERIDSLLEPVRRRHGQK